METLLRFPKKADRNPVGIHWKPHRGPLNALEIQKGTPWQCKFCIVFLYTYISSTCTPLQPLTMSWNSTWHMCNGHPYPNQSKKNTKKQKTKTKKTKKTKKQEKPRLHTPRGGGQMQRVGVCNLVFFLFFLVRWFVSEGLVKSVGRPYSLPLLPF